MFVEVLIIEMFLSVLLFLEVFSIDIFLSVSFISIKYF